MTRKYAAGILGAALIATNAACGGPIQEGPGPLFSADGRDSTCAPTPLAAPFTFGTIMLDNPTDLPLTIDRVAFLDANGLELIQAIAVPDPSDPNGLTVRAGAMKGFPPVDQKGQTLDWSARVDVRGFVVAPDGQAAPSQLVLGVKGTRPISSARAIEILYHDEDQMYRAVIESRLTLVDQNTGITCEDSAVESLTDWN